MPVNFRPRFAPVKAFETVADSLAFLGNEDVISLKPMFARHLEVPNIVVVPLTDKRATWEVFIAWQRGKTSAPVRALISALSQNRVVRNS